MLNIKQLTWLLVHPNLLQNQYLFSHVPLEMFNRPTLVNSAGCRIYSRQLTDSLGFVLVLETLTPPTGFRQNMLSSPIT